MCARHPEPLSVLVVDGYPDAAVSLADLLVLVGHQARVAFDADGALAEIRADRPDVVISETVLPGTNGYELARRIAALPGPRPCLIAVTTQGRDPDRERARAAGFDHLLLKPADPAELLGLVEAWQNSAGPTP
jgi:CheY-like chemotaxis protein